MGDLGGIMGKENNFISENFERWENQDNIREYYLWKMIEVLKRNQNETFRLICQSKKKNESRTRFQILLQEICI